MAGGLLVAREVCKADSSCRGRREAAIREMQKGKKESRGKWERPIFLSRYGVNDVQT